MSSSSLRSGTWDGWQVDPGPEDLPWSDGASPDAAQDAAPTSVLADLHYLGTALRRGRGVWVGAALAGLLLAVAALLAVPAPHRASTLLVLSHDPLVDPARALQTDLGLATTRAVADRTIAELDLVTTPEKLLNRVTVTSDSADTAVIELSAPSDAEAVRQLTTYTQAYLALRSEQVTAQAEAVAEGSQARIEELRGQVEALTQQIDAVPAGETGLTLLGDLVGQRSQLLAQIGTLEQTWADAQLRTAAVVSASRVVDAPRAEPGTGLRRAVLALVTGVLGGGGLGVVVVIGRALASTRLRRRDEVGLALGAPVVASVGRLGGRVPGSGRRQRRQAERRRLACALQRQLPAVGWRQRLVVGCVDNATEVAPVVVELAEAMAAAGRTVHLVDLTERGVLTGAAVPVLRPDDVPSLSQGPSELAEQAGADAAELAFPSDGQAVLVLADLHPAIGVAHLVPWAERVVVAVSAGGSDAEQVIACGRMLRDAGLQLGAAVLLRADAADTSYSSVATSPS